MWILQTSSKSDFINSSVQLAGTWLDASPYRVKYTYRITRIEWAKDKLALNSLKDGLKDLRLEPLGRNIIEYGEGGIDLLQKNMKMDQAITNYEFHGGIKRRVSSHQETVKKSLN